MKHHMVLEIFLALVQRCMHLRGTVADDTNVVDIQVVVRQCFF